MSFIITVNEPGYLPETDPTEVVTLPEALDALRDEIERTADVEDVEVPEFDAPAIVEQVETWGEFSVSVAGWNHEIRKVAA